MRNSRLSQVALAAAALVVAGSLQAQVIEDYDFETGEGFTLGSLDTQLGWSVNAGTADVVDMPLMAGSGDNYVAQGADSEIEQAVSATPDDADDRVIFRGWYYGSGSSMLAAPSDTAEPDVALLIGFEEAGAGQIAIKAYDPTVPGFVPEPATQTFSATSWNKVVAVLNYSTETYNVFVNDAAYLTDVPFKTSGVSALNGFKSFSASASNIDLVGFFFSEDGDFDGDGIADDVDPDPLVAAPQEPEVEVAVVGGAAITDGGGPVDFGTETEGTTPATIVFEVSNTGNAELTTSNLDVPGGFTIVGQLAASIPAGSSDTFSVSLDTSIVGTFNGDILFDNNDADENPFNFSVTGTVEADTPAWGRAQGDFNGDGCTNLTDFLFLASNWMQDPDGAGPEAPITLTDFLALASNWMQGPNC